MRKKISWLIMIMITTLFLAGCNNGSDESAFNAQVNLGLDAVAAEKYESAKTHFDNALKIKPTDKSAKAYVSQTSNYIEASNDFSESKFDSAISTALKVSNQKNGSDGLKTHADKLIKEVNSTIKNQKNYQALYDKAKKEADSDDNDAAKTTLNILLSHDLSNKYYKDIEVAASTLVKTVDAELKITKAASADTSTSDQLAKANEHTTTGNESVKAAKSNSSASSAASSSASSSSSSSASTQTIPEVLVGTWTSATQGGDVQTFTITKNALMMDNENYPVSEYRTESDGSYTLRIGDQGVTIRHLTQAEGSKEYKINYESIIYENTVYAKGQ